MRNLQIGDRVVIPSTIACGNCFFCQREQYSLCENSNPNAWMAEKMWGHSPCGIYGYSHLTGGYAGGGIKAALNDTTLPPGAQNFSTSGWHHGWALGAGLEYAFSRNISIKGEYLYTKLETKPTFAPPRLIESGLQQNLLRAGVNYRF